MSLQAVFKQLVMWDVTLFHLINNSWYRQWLADLFYVIAEDHLILIFLILCAGLYAWRMGWKKSLTLGVWGAVALLCSNLLQNNLLKLIFNRPRPFMALADVHLCVPLNNLAGLSLSFPSTHASSAAALAMVAIHLNPRLFWPAVGFAGMIGFGSIYTGGHYPLDVLAGYGFGIALGWGVALVSRATWPGEQERFS